MPRAPNPRTEACFVTATLSPLSNQQQTVAEFKKERFQYYAPSHDSVIVIGSTFQNARAQGKTHVLDASSILYNTGDCGERTGVVMALADGAGKDSDERVTLSIGLVAKAACDRLVSGARCNNDANQLANAVVNAGHISEKDALISASQLDEALTLLNHSLNEPLFNTHRNNKIITGAFGDTSAVKKIRAMINDVKAEQKKIARPTVVQH